MTGFGDNCHFTRISDMAGTLHKILTIMPLQKNHPAKFRHPAAAGAID
jgi:hypothetical protein